MTDKDKQIRKSKLRWFGIGLAVIGPGAIGAYFAWPQISLRVPADVIIVKAVDGPIKVRPSIPAGTTVAHQDLLVIDMLKSGVATSDEFETLRPNLSSPEPPPIDDDKSSNISIKGKSLTVATDNSTFFVRANPEIAKLEKKPERVSPKPIVGRADEPTFIIQLAAFRSAEKASEIASLLSRKHGRRLDGIVLKTMRLDTGSNGIFFRVVSPPLPRMEAETACVNLRRAGQDCFLRKFTVPQG